MTTGQAAAELDRRVSKHIADWTNGGNEKALQAAFRLFLLNPDEKFSKMTNERIRWAFRCLYNLAEAGAACRQDLLVAKLDERKNARTVLSRLLVPKYEGRGLTDKELLTGVIVETLIGLSPVGGHRSVGDLLRDKAILKSLRKRLRDEGYTPARIKKHLCDHLDSIHRTYRRRLQQRP
jgi:hypothetical protein